MRDYLLVQGIGDGSDFFVSYPLPVLVRQVLRLSLDALQRTDVIQCLSGQFTLVGDVQVVELATGIREATDLGNAFAEARLVAGVVFTHQLAVPAAPDGAGVFIRPAGRKVVDRGLQFRERRATVGPHVGPVSLFSRQGPVRLAAFHPPTAGFGPRRPHPGSQRRTRGRQTRLAEDAFLTG